MDLTKTKMDLTKTKTAPTKTKMDLTKTKRSDKNKEAPTKTKMDLTKTKTAPTKTKILLIPMITTKRCQLVLPSIKPKCLASNYGLLRICVIIQVPPP
ncbi:hypothetical protein BSPWISOXPB_2516 [uncultured Gammaproteobacteria bacterium]|nr:hypothetical protein BSPWISOXPB_2516 [uncultured Gammaproteobacteria bacterium]